MIIEGQLVRGTLVGKYTDEVKALWPELAPLALSGRVPVKVITNPGESIEPGQAIVSSNEKGIGQTAKVASMSVGKTITTFNHSAMSCTPVNSTDDINWPADPDGNNAAKPCFTLPDGRHVGKVMIMVSNSYVDPTIAITDSGSLVITGDLLNGYEVINQATPVTNINAFFEIVVSNISAGFVSTQDLIVEKTATIKDLNVESFTINGVTLADYITSVTGGQVTSNGTALIAPVGNDTIITTATVSGEIAFTNTNGNTVAAITEDGNFNATGTSSLGSLLVQDDATISGTLTAQEVIADTSKLGTLLVDNEATFSATISAESIITNELNATSSRLEQLETKLAQVEKLEAVAAQIETDATVSGTLFAENIDGLDKKLYTATAENK